MSGAGSRGSSTRPSLSARAPCSAGSAACRHPTPTATACHPARPANAHALAATAAACSLHPRQQLLIDLQLLNLHRRVAAPMGRDRRGVDFNSLGQRPAQCAVNRASAGPTHFRADWRRRQVDLDVAQHDRLRPLPQRRRIRSASRCGSPPAAAPARRLLRHERRDVPLARAIAPHRQPRVLHLDAPHVRGARASASPAPRRTAASARRSPATGRCPAAPLGSTSDTS